MSGGSRRRLSGIGRRRFRMRNICARKRGRDLFRRASGLLNVLSGFYSCFPMKMRIGLLAWHRRTRGKIGLGIRYSLLRTIAASCGDNVSIHSDVYLLCPQNLSIGSNVSLHPMCYLEASGNIEIGNDVSVAHGVSIISTNHGYSDEGMPIKDQPIVAKRIAISDNVWIGAQAIILAGVRIESGCVVAAGAVVTKSTAKDGIYAGVPARKIKARDK